MQRWYQISKDPNSQASMQARKNMLVAARTKTSILNRVDYFCEMARGKDILDVGVVDHTIELTDSPDWLHGKLCQAAKTCLGVDILEEEVNKLKRKGFNLICTDITEKPLNQTFDLIICGDIIEHLDQPGYLLASAAQMLRPFGKILLSVPNPWYINVLLKNTFNGSPYLDNVDHVSWFDPCTLCELGQRHGLALNNFVGVAVQEPSKLPTQLFFNLSPFFIRLGLRPELFCKTVIYEFVLGDEYEKTFASY
ncbi:class I SAM-dependent methyltransferase [Allocoleopsis sp.]|uniref:class I SAM-dependent methyltransferase n=1 Tax=Allocoleopsis sp. TaxID=3088169 RepID=UPI002FD0279D